jgi:CBS domain-containing protein
MTTISQLLNRKGRQVWSIGPDATVYEAVVMLAEKEVGALAVLEGETMVGIVSERDYARKVILQGRSSREMKVREIMTARVLYAKPDQSIEECMAMMTEKRIRHLPVMDGRELLGMISLGDLVKEIINEQRATIQQLEQYIAG